MVQQHQGLAKPEEDESCGFVRHFQILGIVESSFTVRGMTGVVREYVDA